MARYKDFNHGSEHTRHGEKVSHIRPFNWNHQILGSQHCPDSSLGRFTIGTGKERNNISDEQVDVTNPQLSNKTFLLNKWFSLLRSSCSNFF